MDMIIQDSKMKDLFYVGKETSTGKKVLVHKEDYDELGNKATESLKDMGIEVNTNKIVIKAIDLFDELDCWD